MLNKGTHHCAGLQKWFDGHSYTDISWRILEDAGFPSKLCLLERKWFDILHPLYWGKEPTKTRTIKTENKAAKDKKDSLNYSSILATRDDAMLVMREAPDVVKAILDLRDSISQQGHVCRTVDLRNRSSEILRVFERMDSP